MLPTNIIALSIKDGTYIEELLKDCERVKNVLYVLVCTMYVLYETSVIMHINETSTTNKLPVAEISFDTY